MSLAHQIVATGSRPEVSLVRYDAACRAIAEAVAVDEIKSIRDQAIAMAAAAKIAKNLDAEADMKALRFRAERRLGELIASQREAGLLSRGGGDHRVMEKPSAPITLAEVGIDKNLADRARKYAAVPEEEFNQRVDEYRERVAVEGERAVSNLLKAGERAEQARRENDFYPTPDSLIAEVAARWKPFSRVIWEPCAGDGRVADALRLAGHEVVTGDIAQGSDFFAFEAPPRIDIALCTNPPFGRVREFIDHAFAIGIQEMCLVLPERLWACGTGREQFERHRPSVWINMDWREDYLGKGGSPDRALAVAIWESPCAPACRFDVWTRQAASDAETFDPETGEITTSNSQQADSSQEAADKAGETAPPPAVSPATNSSSESSDGVAHEVAETPIGEPHLFEGEGREVASSPLRPHCLKPELCASGGGRKHCHRCTVAAGLSEAA